MKQKYVMNNAIRTQEPKTVTRVRYHKGHYRVQSETHKQLLQNTFQNKC